MFQSSPSPKAGSYSRRSGRLRLLGSFNPLPARRPGATLIWIGVLRTFEVSILSQPEGRELHAPCRPGDMPFLFQSSPSPKAGSYPLFRRSALPIFEFQSSPSPKAGSYGIRE